MQVFVCDSSMSRSAQMLDSKRLNKQIVEAFQLVEDRLPNLHHPAYMFWKEHKKELRMYMSCLCAEYTRRYGKEHKCANVASKPTTDSFASFIPEFDLLLLSHRVNLLRKDENWYSQFFSVPLPLTDYPNGYYWNAPYARSSQDSTKAWKKYYDKF